MYFTSKNPKNLRFFFTISPILDPRLSYLGDHEISGGFVAQTCWIQGVYVYKELKDRIDEVAYFGIPKDITQDGFLKSSENKDLCQLTPKLGAKKNDDCIPMQKTFYLQVQIRIYLFIVFMYFSLSFNFEDTVDSLNESN